MRVAGCAFLLAAALLVSTLAAPHEARAGSTPDISKAIAWLVSLGRSGQGTQDAVFGTSTNGVPESYVVEAISQTGVDPKAWPSTDAPVWNDLAPATDPTSDLGYKEDLRVLDAAGTSGYGGADIKGQDLVQVARAGFLGGQFGQAQYINDDVWAILALRAAGVPANDTEIQQAAMVIENARVVRDGGWSYATVATTSDADDTGMALAALAAAGVDVAGDARALAFLDSQWDPTTKLYQGASAANAESTVWALHGYHLLGRDHKPGALGALAALQNADGGFALSPGKTSDPRSTAEAILLFAGAHYPLPGYAPTRPVDELHALAPVTPTLNASFSRTVWDFGAQLGVTNGEVTFPHAGTYDYRLFAESATARYRGSGTLTVLSARPLVETPLDVQALRHEPVDLDLSGSHDPDGSIASWRVDWGDGNATSGTSHAYDLPGDRTARVVATDDSGVESLPTFVLVHVLDRAPIFGAFPGTMLADRVSDVTISPNVTDPDGDAVALTWSADGATGAGALVLRFDRLGAHVVTFVAHDPFGAEADANVTVLVQNLPPTLVVALPENVTEGDHVPLAANASDPDGPAPTVARRIDGALFAGALWNATAGTHAINVTATDADSGVASWNGTLVVRARGAAQAPVASAASPVPSAPSSAVPPPAARGPPPLDAPRIDVPAHVVAGLAAPIHVELPEGASSVALDLGDGNTTDAPSLAHAWALPGAYELRATARASDGRASTTSVVLRVEAAAQRGADAPAGASSALPVVESLKPAAISPAPSPAGPPTVQALQGSARETPAPAWLATAGALLLAAAGTLASRGRR